MGGSLGFRKTTWAVTLTRRRGKWKIKISVDQKDWLREGHCCEEECDSAQTDSIAAL